MYRYSLDSELRKSPHVKPWKNRNSQTSCSKLVHKHSNGIIKSDANTVSYNVHTVRDCNYVIQGCLFFTSYIRHFHSISEGLEASQGKHDLVVLHSIALDCANATSLHAAKLGLSNVADSATSERPRHAVG